MAFFDSAVMSREILMQRSRRSYWPGHQDEARSARGSGRTTTRALTCFFDGDPKVGKSLDQELLSELVCAHRGECVTCMAHRFEFLATLCFSALFTRPWLVSLFAPHQDIVDRLRTRKPLILQPFTHTTGVMQNTILYRGRGVTTDLIRSTTRTP